MRAIVVPFRGANGKSRLPEPVRAELAVAMLGDVLSACTETGPTMLVTDDAEAIELAALLGAATATDPGGGQSAAVVAALARTSGPVLVVNADVPCVTADDLLMLGQVAEAGAVGVVEAADGTTNALGLPHPRLFAPLYGPGSAERFRAHARARGRDSVSVVIPNLADDVDTIEDLERVRLRAGPRTQSILVPL